jgi:Tol biopolymer transport system component
MNLDELASSAVTDLLDVSTRQAVGGWADLHRRRRRRAVVRGACVVAVLALVLGGVALLVSARDRAVQPAHRGTALGHGALLGLPSRLGEPLRLLSGVLHGAVPVEQALPSPSAVVGVAFSPDGTQLRSYDVETGRMVAVDLESRRERTVWQCPDGDLLCSGPTTLSPDGHRVAQLTGFGNPRLEVTDLDTRQVAVRRGVSAGPPVWSPDGTQLMLPTGHGIELLPADLASSRLLAPLDDVPQGSMSAGWSPDGTRVVYAEPSLDRGSGRTSFRLVVADVATGSTEVIHELGDCVCKSLNWPQVAWSPDGALIAASTVTQGDRFATPAGVFVMRPDGSDAERVGPSLDFLSVVWQPVVFEK